MIENKDIEKSMTISLRNELPEMPVFEEGIRRAPDRGYRLSKDQTKLALRNALRYIPQEHHEALAPEFLDELTKEVESMDIDLDLWGRSTEGPLMSTRGIA